MQLSVRSSVDRVRLRRELPTLPTAEQIAAARSELAEAYREYTKEVSTGGMAASLETMSLLLALCRTSDVRSAVDLGSGFSSFVLRVWAAESDASVSSVDTDANWLARTAAFLEQRSSAPGRLSIWPDAPRSVELVFHDLSGGELREQTMSKAVAMGTRFVLLDDAQHRGHRKAMARACASAGVPLYSLRSMTLDGIRRFAMLAVRT